ncbi:MAG: hypothetical protein A2043_02860 [Candidatus Schekmanbacteria bacterium GWA2_38_9]|uniref:Glycosyl transferase family 1 domain-containing protein n=1 Tax=Candidatus Schekmanbacteria bacterium RIFCSPLOWO2_12_FULL_38_15 TaxID=1817883 RepID=A0A1F7SNQ9_9BACT|nr:MAG: hypothetical protein A2043_02860 [Candidatus Schekmanbacteria bacterium GWA2_38_9]OGL50273.1 MAG: hypothetical protein A3H37_00780 [Candidatus Schekmanbacteria bacterium RIFCSPLOWO2_02_FULL_38_14]OGL55416.1 MAG: hypothetical protein A3G31_01220 [Candidatus Schekmanbacteria bacterium RIFCSPLOWO2_12_FULL_38_15]
MTKIAFIDLTFCWPQWVPSSLELKEVASRLQKHGYKINLFYPCFTEYLPRGVITSNLPFPTTPIPFNRFTFNFYFLAKRMKKEIEKFSPHYVFIWDGYSLKPHIVMEFFKDFPVILKLCSFEILCIKTTLFNNNMSVCNNLFLKNPDQCIECYFKGNIFKNFINTFFRPNVSTRFYHLAHEFFSSLAFRNSYIGTIKESFEKAESVIVSNSFAKNLLDGYSSNIKIIHHGVDSKYFYPGKEAMKKYKGIFMPERLDGLEHGFPAFVSAVEALLNNNVKILLIHDDFFEPIRSDRFKSNNYLFFFQSRKGIQPELYQMSDITVHPNVKPDSNGLRAVEAMACGKPVIASDIGVFKDIVDDGKTGFLVEPGNNNQLSEKIDILLRDDKLRTEMGKEGRKKVEAEYEWDIIIQRDYLPLFRNYGNDN